MAFSLVQASTDWVAASGVGTPGVITLGSTITAGSTLIVVAAMDAANNRSFTISDSVQGTTGWVDQVFSDSATSLRQQHIWTNVNHPGGSVTITVAISGSGVFQCFGMEWAGFGTVITLEGGEYTSEITSSTDHNASVGGLSSANPCVAVLAAETQSSSTITLGTGYTSPLNALARYGGGYQIFSSGVSGETGNWTSSIARPGASILGLFSGNGGGAPPGGQPLRLRLGGVPHMSGCFRFGRSW